MAARVADADAGAASELLSLVDAAQRARADAVPLLLGQVDSAGRVRRERCMRLLLELTPMLEAARAKERERDRKEAHRFNVFRYLRTDELGISRMIADLLDPAAEHGQGPVFLNAMLDMLSGLDILSDSGEKTRALLGSPRATVATAGSLPATAASPAKVVTERWVPNDGYIDISVEIPSDRGRFCLAFENKPYAHDGHRQLRKYLEYLDSQYGRRFLLVYVPPQDREPGEWSLAPEEREYWSERGQFRVVPYSGGEASIDAWFEACHTDCEAERLKVYLEDAQSFCRQRFGGFTVTTESETHFIRKHLTDNPGQMHAALAVYKAWPAIRSEVYERFLRHLHRKVEARVRREFPAAGDLLVRRYYEGDKKYRNRLWISRDSWSQPVPPSRLAPGSTTIMLVNASKSPDGWYWGVRSPKPEGKMSETEQKRLAALKAALRDRGLSLTRVDDWWPQWEFLPRHKDWYPIAPDLAEELEAGGGTITDYYVDGLLRIARLAIPAIDEVEAASPTPADSPEPVDSDE